MLILQIIIYAIINSHSSSTKGQDSNIFIVFSKVD